MARDDLTLTLDGDVSIHDFATAISALDRLIKSLTEAIADDKSTIRWVVTELEAGSATTTLTGYAESQQDVQGVIAAYSIVGRALSTGGAIPYSEKVRREAQKIMSVLGGEVSSITFDTTDERTTVLPELKGHREVKTSTSFGAVEGRVQTLSNRAGVKFTLFDAIHDKPVQCYLETERQDELRDLWGKRVLVEGMVTRNARTGHPFNIRQISFIEVLPIIEPGTFREARGVLEYKEPADITIRRLRDAWR